MEIPQGRFSNYVRLNHKIRLEIPPLPAVHPPARPYHSHKQTLISIFQTISEAMKVPLKKRGAAAEKGSVGGKSTITNFDARKNDVAKALRARSKSVHIRI
jgi:hypothetical protein